MVQIILIIVGVLALTQKEIKISKTKRLLRPKTTYLGIILLVYGVGISLIPESINFSVAHYISLVVVTSIFFFLGKDVTENGISGKNDNL